MVLTPQGWNTPTGYSGSRIERTTRCPHIASSSWSRYREIAVNYYDARELKDRHGNGLGHWHYTVANRRLGTWPVGYCAELDCEHHSSTEARECYRQYLLREKTHEVTFNQAEKCLVCEAWTPTALIVGNGREFFLCDEHRTIEEVAKRFGTVGSIYSSD